MVTTLFVCLFVCFIMETLQAEASLQGIQVNHIIKAFAEMNVQKTGKPCIMLLRNSLSRAVPI